MSFQSDLGKFAKATGLEIEVVVGKLAFDVLKSVIQKTPIKTGRAKANWNLGLGSIDYTVTKSTTFKLVVPPKGSGNKVIYITNSLPYITNLENGDSKQARGGMVKPTMSEINRSIRSVVR